MVFNFILPREGGGAIRRFFNIRHRLLRDAINDERPLKGPLSLFDFRRRDDAADLKNSLDKAIRLPFVFGGWRTSDDGVIGGFSTSDLKFLDSSFEKKLGDAAAAAADDAHSNGDTDREEDGGASASSNGTENEATNGDEPEVTTPPFLRWNGSISTEVGRTDKARHVSRSGFAAVLSPEYPLGMPLGNRYNALEICCRTDGRTYAVNLHVESYFPDDIYQGFISIPGHPELLAVQEEESVGVGVDDGSVEDDEALQSTIKNGETAGSDKVELSGASESIPESDQMAHLASLIAKEADDAANTAPVQDDTDVRSYMKARETEAAASDTKEDQYYGHPPKGFVRLIMPFRNFVLTARGRMRHTQRELDGAIAIGSIGLTLMDGKEGPFAFDLVSMRAVNVMNDEVVGMPEEVKDKEAHLERKNLFPR